MLPSWRVATAFFAIVFLIENKLSSSAQHKNSGMPGTSRYVTTKNRKNTPERLELMKYNPILKKMTLHKEIK